MIQGLRYSKYLEFNKITIHDSNRKEHKLNEKRQLTDADSEMARCGNYPTDFRVASVNIHQQSWKKWKKKSLSKKKKKEGGSQIKILELKTTMDRIKSRKKKREGTRVFSDLQQQKI